MRAFIAMALPDEVRLALTELQRDLATSRADVKWVGQSQLHLTLRFLGEVTDEQRGAVERLLAQVGQRHAPFSLRLNGVGAFPSPGAPRVVWVGVTEGQAEVTQLAKTLEEGIQVLGLPKAERPFSAHVTLGRVRSPRRRKPLTALLAEAPWQPPAAFRVEAMRLYQSVLSPHGPHHTVLADVLLTGGGVSGNRGRSAQPGP